MSQQYKFTANDIVGQGRTTEEKVQSIKTWLSKLNGQIVPKVFPDELIVLFLLSCENNLEFTKVTILTYFRLKRDAPELHDNRKSDGEDIKSAMETWRIISLPVRTKENYVINYFKIEDSDYKKFQLIPFLRAALMLDDVSQNIDPPADGITIIIDVEGIGFMHLTKLNLSAMKKFLSYVQEGVPIKLRTIHFLNSNTVLTKTFSLIKSFINADVLQKIHFHPSNMSMEKFYEYIPQQCLPKDYGGDLPSSKELHEHTKVQFKNMQLFWDWEENFRKSCL